MDIVEMTPVSKKVSAPTAGGAKGSALAVIILKAADKVAEQEVKAAESRKDTLKRICAFTREDHLAFRKALDDRLQIYKDTAASLGLTFEALKASDPKASSISATVSMWRKMSEAVEAGYRPEFEQPWAYISACATTALMAKAADHVGNPENPARSAPTIKKRGRPSKSNVEKALALLDGMPVQDLETIGLWIASKIGKSLPYKAIKT